jgi:class 3 adenylate cyclase/tetratricopeptide (TPR) repeat protein
MAEAPSGTVTFLFTDIEGSTGLWDRHPQAMPAVLARHDEILRTAVQTYRGSVFKQTGDGICAAFSRAPDGVAAAVDAQRALQSQPWGEVGSLRARMALHAGTCEITDGDYFGPALNRCARLMAAAHGGQVICSQTVYDLIRDDVPADVRLNDLGKHRLRDLTRVERVFQVIHPALRASFPSLRTPRESDDAIGLLSVNTWFIGREREMQALHRQMEQALAGPGGILLLFGDPGIGKTRTLEEFAAQAQGQGARVLWGRCHEGKGAPAFWPWIQIIRRYIRDCDPAALRAQIGAGAADIAQVVPEIRERLADLPPPLSLEPAQARFRLFDSVTTFLNSAAGARPLVVILDDLHWADVPSLLLFKFLAVELGGVQFPSDDEGGTSPALLLVGAYRDAELPRTHPVAQALADLARQPYVQRMHLSGLAEYDVRRFIEMTVGRALPTRLVTTVYRETEGNPFFIIEIMRLLVAEGALERSEEERPWQLIIPETVRQVIRLRLGHLSAICHQVLTMASVIGREFPSPALERSMDLPITRLLEALDEAETARVIAPVPGSPSRYRFLHALIRETLYGDLPTASRVELHLRMGEALEKVYGTNPDPHLSELAHHFFEAAPLGQAERAIGYAVRSAERATHLLAHEEAVRHYEMALQLLQTKDSPDERQVCEVLLRLGEAHNRAGGREEARATFLRAAESARKLGAPEALTRAALGFGGVVLTAGIVDGVLVDLLEEALAALPGDRPLRVRALARLAQELYFSRARERRVELSQQAVEMARRIGDSATLAAALFSRHMAIWDSNNLDERLRVASEIVHLGEESHNPELILQGRRWLVPDLLELGDIPAFRREMAAHATLATELRQPLYLWDATRWQAVQALLEGRLGEAEQLIQESLVLGRRVLSGTANYYFVFHMLTLRREQGRLAEVQAILNGVIDRFPELLSQRCWLAQLYCELDREPEARKEFERLAADDFERIPKDLMWLPAMSLLAQVCAFLRDAPRAGLLYTLLLPYADRVAVAGSAMVCYGTISRYLGLLATIMAQAGTPQTPTTQRQFEDAATHFEQALAANARMGARALVAHTQYEYAGALLAAGQQDDERKALDLLGDAVSTAHELGMTRLAKLAGAHREQTLAQRTAGTSTARAHIGTQPHRGEQ